MMRTTSHQFLLRPSRGPLAPPPMAEASGPLAGGAPGRSVARTRMIAFSLERKAAPAPLIVERKPIGWRALEWRRMLDDGVYRNQSALALGEGVSTAAVGIALAKLRSK